MSNYVNELVQVAAVAVAMLQQELGVEGTTRRSQKFDDWQYLEDHIIDLIEIERAAQERKWGERAHGREKWIAILGEEFGEVCRAVLENK